MKCVEVFVLCVMCMCTWCVMFLHLLLDVQGRGSLVMGFVLLFCVSLCEVLSLPCVVLSLCVCVLVPGNVISGGCTISDGSS